MLREAFAIKNKTAARLDGKKETKAMEEKTQAVQKQFDVALVDPSNPAIEHYPRVRVTVDVDSATAGDVDAIAVGKKSLITDFERQQAIAAYNRIFGLTRSDLRYDIVPAATGSAAPAMPEVWAKHLKEIGLA